MAVVWQWELVKWLGVFSSLCCLIIGLLTWFNAFVLELSFTTQRIGYLSVFGILCFTTSIIANTFLRMTVGYDHEDEIIHWIPSIIYSSAWVMGQIFVYLLFIERLKYSFKGSKYENKRSYYYKFYIGICLFALSSFAFQITRILHETGIIKQYLFVHSGEIRDLSQQMIDIYLSIAMLYAFNKKLWILNLDLSIFANSSVHQSALSLNAKQESIINISARLTVISSFAIISTQCLMIYTTIVYELCSYSNCGQHKYLIYIPIADAFWGIDCVINCGCIFLSFDYLSAEATYNWLCHCCHCLCIKCYASMTKTKLQKQHPLQTKLLRHSSSL